MVPGRKLNNIIRSICVQFPDAANKPIHLISPTGFKDYFETLDECLNDPNCERTYVTEVSNFRDLIGNSMYFVAYVTYREV